MRHWNCIDIQFLISSGFNLSWRSLMKTISLGGLNLQYPDLQVDLGHSGLDYFNSGFLPYTIPPMLHEYVNIEFLRSLSLAHVDITGEIIENILSVCSQLERLSVNTSSYLGGLIVAGSSLKLLFLEILVDSNMKDVYHISAPNLDSLVIGGAKVGLQVKFAPCLLHLDIKIPYRKSLQDALDGESMCYLRQLQTLVLKFSSNVVPKYLGQLPEMVNLKHLVLQAQPPIVGNGDHVLDAIRVLMKASPFLQKFTLQFYPFLRGKRKHAVTVESVADCFLQHLKLVEIEGFIGHQVCDELVTYFLDYGISLEKLIINARCFLNSAEAPRSSRKFAEEARAREWARQLQAKASSGVEFVIL